MNNAIKAIETSYKGYRFRSRLEARWAVFFDEMGLQWEYEPEGFELKSGRYLPDLKVHYPAEGWYWFECKGDLSAVTDNEWARMIEFESECGLIVLDGTPDIRMYQTAKDLVDHLNDSSPSRPYRLADGALDEKRSGYALWSYKGRPWWDCYKDFWHHDYGRDELVDAVFKARSARFEHGECGAAA